MRLLAPDSQVDIAARAVPKGRGRRRARAWALALALLAAGSAVAMAADALAAAAPDEDGFLNAAQIEGKARAAKRLRLDEFPTPDPRQERFDVVDYANQFFVDTDYELLWGWTRVRLAGGTPPAQELVLDFADSLAILGVKREGSEDYVACDRTDGRLAVALPRPLAPGDTTAVDIYYMGRPSPDGFLGFEFRTLASGAPLASTLSEPWSARSWWPCKDDPRDRATMSARVWTLAGLTAVSNGTFVNHVSPSAAAKSAGVGPPLVDHVPRSAAAAAALGREAFARARDQALKGTSAPGSAAVPGAGAVWAGLLAVAGEPRQLEAWEWRANRPLATYHFSLAISQYEQMQDLFVADGDTLPIRHFVYPELVDACAVDFAKIPRMLQFSVDKFGPFPFPGEKYGMALFEWDGAMEHPTAVSWGRTLVSGTNRYESVVMHELAHEWFGNEVTCADWTQTWLNEGFATYAEALWKEQEYGAASRKTFMIQRSVFWVWEGPLVREPGVADPAYYFADMVYFKGSWVLHMLRRLVGDPLFFQCLREWLADPKAQYGAADSDDFVRVCEKVTDRELGWFFDQWLYRTTYPELAIRYANLAPSGPDNVRLTLTQAQATDPLTGDDPFRIPVELALSGAGWCDTVRVFLDARTQDFLVTTPGPVTGVVLDPERWLLGRALSVTGVEGDGDEGPGTAPAGGTPPSARLLPPAPNPFNPRVALRWEATAATADVLTVRDARGRLLLRRAWPERPAGERLAIWDGRDGRSRSCPSGVYLYRIDCRPATGAPAIRLQGRVTLAR